MTRPAPSAPNAILARGRTRLDMMVIVGIIVSLVQAPTPTQAVDHGAFLVTVIGYERGAQYTARYRLDPPPTPKIAVSGVQATGPGRDPLAELLRELKARRETRRQAAPSFRVALHKAPKWVDPSPDGRYAFIGFEDPAAGVMQTALVVKTSRPEVVREFKLTGGNYIRDFAWSADSRVLAVLEGRERYSKSPRDLVYLIFGHPVPLDTLWVTFVTADSGAVIRAPVVQDVRYATASITRAE